MDKTKQIVGRGNELFEEVVPVWSVYLLFKDDKIIYIGCSGNIEQRISIHKSKMDFDSYLVYFRSSVKSEAEFMERRIISFCSSFTDHPIQNKWTFNNWGHKKIKI